MGSSEEESPGEIYRQGMRSSCPPSRLAVDRKYEGRTRSDGMGLEEIQLLHQEGRIRAHTPGR